MNAYTDFAALVQAAEKLKAERQNEMLSMSHSDFERSIQDLPVLLRSQLRQEYSDVRWHAGNAAHFSALAKCPKEKAVTQAQTDLMKSGPSDREGIDRHAAGCSHDSNGLRIL